MSVKVNWIFVAALLAVIAAVTMAGPRIGAGLAYRPNALEAAAGVLTSLLVIALLVERALAVVNALVCGDEQRVARVGMLSDDGGTRAASVRAMVRVLTAKERLRIMLGLAAGVFISLAGARTLEGLLVRQPNPFLSAVDVLLTAGLIAGGSNGIAFLITLLKTKLTPSPAPAAEIEALLVTTG
jgi:hypothetical protein